jgi:hypothetical protein
MKTSLRIKKTEINLNKTEFKSTVTNLNNIFIGSMIIAVVLFSIWMWKVFSFWLFVIPVSYILLCYVGRFIKENYFQNIKELQQ